MNMSNLHAQQQAASNMTFDVLSSLAKRVYTNQNVKQFHDGIEFNVKPEWFHWLLEDLFKEAMSTGGLNNGRRIQ